MSTRERLVKRLKDKDGHLGREGGEIQKLAGLSGLSVHALQSFARGQRTLRPDNDKALREALAGRKAVAVEA